MAVTNKEGDTVSYNINNGGNNSNSADILQFIGQWLTTTGDTWALISQAIALKQD